MEKKIKIDNYKLKYEHFIRNVKYPRLEYKTGKLRIITPVSYKNPINLIQKKLSWIIEKQKKITEFIKKSKNRKIIKRDFKTFKKLTYSIALYYANELKLSFKKIYYRKMKAKWASCSSKNNINLNKKMIFLPLYLIRYIIYHELLHIKIKKHNKEFWHLIKNRFPKYEKYEKILNEYFYTLEKINHSKIL